MASIKQESKQSNKFQWIFFAVFIPIVFAITLALVISTVAGVNPFMKAQEFGSQIPILSSFVDHPEEEKQEREIAKYEAKVKNQEAKISDLEAQITTKEEKIAKLQQQISEYEQLLQEQEKNEADEKEAVSKLSSSFSAMEPTRASEILVEMKQQLAIKVLLEIPDETRGKILGSMDAENAAKFSNALFE